MEWVLYSDWLVFERKWNGSIFYFEGNVIFLRGIDIEYVFILFGVLDVLYRFLDLLNYLFFKFVIYVVWDIGLFMFLLVVGGLLLW